MLKIGFSSVHWKRRLCNCYQFSWNFNRLKRISVYKGPSTLTTRPFLSDRFGLGRFGLSHFGLSCFGLANSVWPFQSRDVSVRLWNLTLMERRAVWFKAYSLHHHIAGYHRSRHSTQSFTIRNSGKRCRQGILLGIKFLVVMQSNCISWSRA